MARQIRSRVRRNPGRFREPTRWENLAFQFVHPAAATIVFADLTPEPIQTITTTGTATIKRLLMHFKLTTLLVSPSAIRQDIFVGVGVVTKDAVAAGALPDPLSDFEQSWYYWTGRQITTVVGSTQEVAWDVDIRSMRKLRSGYRLVLVTQSAAEENAMELFASIRTLWSVQS